MSGKTLKNKGQNRASVGVLKNTESTFLLKDKGYERNRIQKDKPVQKAIFRKLFDQKKKDIV